MSPSKTPITYHIPSVQGNGRRLVIPDLHGCNQTLLALLAKIKPVKDDQIFFLGDYLDRGPDAKGVIDTIIGLQENGYKVYPLRGNHEESVIEVLQEPMYEKDLWLNNNHGALLTEKYTNFLLALPFYFKIEGYYLVHAGFNFSHSSPLEDIEDMLWTRSFKPNTDFLQGNRIIHGHDVRLLSEVEDAIKKNLPVIGLDNGCAYKQHFPIYGRLLCLDLDSLQLHKQDNIEINNW